MNGAFFWISALIVGQYLRNKHRLVLAVCKNEKKNDIELQVKNGLYVCVYHVHKFFLQSR